MGYFDDLPLTTQNLTMLQFEFFGKILVIGIFLLFALLYVFVWRKKQKDTPYVLLAVFRTVIFTVCVIFIYFSPLYIFYLYPQVSINTVLTIMLVIFRYVTLVIFIIMFINLIWYAPLVLAKLGGLDIKSKNTNKVFNDLFVKLKKHLGI